MAINDNWPNKSLDARSMNQISSRVMSILEKELERQEEEIEMLKNLLYQGTEAMRLTREYVGKNERGWEILPALPSWSWYDWCMSVKDALDLDLEWAKNYSEEVEPEPEDAAADIKSRLAILIDSAKGGIYDYDQGGWSYEDWGW